MIRQGRWRLFLGLLLVLAIAFGLTFAEGDAYVNAPAAPNLSLPLNAGAADGELLPDAASIERNSVQPTPESVAPGALRVHGMASCSGLPVEGVRVTAFMGESWSGSASTTANGQYAIAVPKPGMLVIWFRCAGYASRSTQAIVHGDTLLDVQLEPRTELGITVLVPEWLTGTHPVVFSDRGRDLGRSQVRFSEGMAAVTVPDPGSEAISCAILIGGQLFRSERESIRPLDERKRIVTLRPVISAPWLLRFRTTEASATVRNQTVSARFRGQVVRILTDSDGIGRLPLAQTEQAIFWGRAGVSETTTLEGLPPAGAVDVLLDPSRNACITVSVAQHLNRECIQVWGTLGEATVRIESESDHPTFVGPPGVFVARCTETQIESAPCVASQGQVCQISIGHDAGAWLRGKGRAGDKVVLCSSGSPRRRETAVAENGTWSVRSLKADSYRVFLQRSRWEVIGRNVTIEPGESKDIGAFGDGDGQTVVFHLPEGEEWKTVSVALPEAGLVLHPTTSDNGAVRVVVPVGTTSLLLTCGEVRVHLSVPPNEVHIASQPLSQAHFLVGEELGLVRYLEHVLEGRGRTYSVVRSSATEPTMGVHLSAPIVAASSIWGFQPCMTVMRDGAAEVRLPDTMYDVYVPEPIDPALVRASLEAVGGVGVRDMNWALKPRVNGRKLEFYLPPASTILLRAPGWEHFVHS